MGRPIAPTLGDVLQRLSYLRALSDVLQVQQFTDIIMRGAKEIGDGLKADMGQTKPEIFAAILAEDDLRANMQLPETARAAYIKMTNHLRGRK